MARSKKRKRRLRAATQSAPHRLDQRRFHACGETLERRYLLSGYGEQAMRFEPNLGQTDPQALFLSRGAGYSLFLTSSEAVLSLAATASATATETAALSVGQAFQPDASAPTPPPAATGAVLAMTLAGANSRTAVTGQDELTSKSNYLNSNDPSKWLTNVPNYGQVAYQDIYPGIDLTYYGNNQQLEYDFTVAAGADPGAIQLSFQGTDKTTLDAQGNLVLHTAVGDVVEQAPVVYQQTAAGRQAVAGGYLLKQNGLVAFQIGAYDHTLPLVIDPVLAYATYLGNSEAYGATAANAITVDSGGNAYLTGSTSATPFDFTTTGGALQTDFTSGLYGFPEAFVTKLDPSGQIVYSTYMGGVPNESKVEPIIDPQSGTVIGHDGYQLTDNVGRGIAVDAKGDVYVTGSTLSGDALGDTFIGFPIVNGFQTTPLGFKSAFVAELAPDGTQLLYSSYLGEDNNQDYSSGYGIAVDKHGNAYVAYNNGQLFAQAFVAKVNADGSLGYNKPLGGDGTASLGSLAIAVDGDGNTYVAGSTIDRSAAVFQVGYQGPAAGENVMVTSLDDKGGILATKQLGGNLDSFGNGIALDAKDNVYITGQTAATDFPTTKNAFQRQKPGGANYLPSAFVAELTPDLSKVIYATYLGGMTGVSVHYDATADSPAADQNLGAGDFGAAIAVDSHGSAYIVGGTSSTDFPTVNALQTAHTPEPTITADGEFPAGPFDGFVTELDPSGSSLVYSTYLGGTGNNIANAVAVDSLGNAYVVGTTDSISFPTTTKAAQQKYDREIVGYPASAYLEGVDITDPYTSFLPETSAFIVRLAPLIKVAAVPVDAYLNEGFQGAVATFNAFDPSENASDFSATIDWGDKVTTDGTVTKAAGVTGLFTVRGNHTYTELGAYPIAVTVHDLKYDVYATSAALVGSFGATYQGDPTIFTDSVHPDKVVLVGGSEDLVGGATALLAGSSDTASQDWGLQNLATGKDGLPQAAGIAAVAQDPDGTIFVLYDTAGSTPKLALIESTDGGDTFQLVTDDYAKGLGQVSTYAIAAGPDPGGNGSRVWIAYVIDKTLQIDGLVVSDTGEIQPDRSFVVADTNDGDPALGDVAVGPDGQVAVAFQSIATDGQSRFYIAAAPFDLVSSEPLTAIAVPATHIVPDMPIPPVPGGINAGLRLAWDRSDGPGKPGTLYMVYTQGDKGSQDTNIELGSSADSGETWSSFQTVNDDVKTVGVSHFYPSLAVDPTTGDVAIGWYDARFDVVQDQGTVFETAVYDPNTGRISANVPATAFLSNAAVPGLDDVSMKDQYGDFTSVAFDNGLLHLAWTDNSPDLRSFQGPAPFNLATSTLAVADVSVAPPVVVGKALDLTEGALVSQSIATFTDGDSSLTAADFQVTIDWGDGTGPAAGIVAAVAGTAGSFEVEATHHYAVAGAYVLSVTVKDTVNMLVGTTDENVSRMAGYQGQGTVTVDPKSSSDLFAVSDADSGFFAAYSSDGGLTWDVRVLADGSDNLPVGESDPKASYDMFGNLFLSYLTENGASVVVAYSADKGQSFQVLKQFSTASGADRDALAVGPGADGEESVWIAYVDGNQKVYVTGAAIAGFTGIGVFVQPLLVPTPATLNAFHYADLAVGPNGEVAVTYLATVDPALPSLVYISVDPNDLNQPTFDPPVLVTTSNVGSATSIPAQAVAMIDVEPRLAWDTAADVHQGRLYLAYTDAAAIDNPDTNVFVRYSDDKGKTWSASVAVNDDKTPASHFLPSIAVDPTDGDVAVAWYDTRNDPAGVATQFFASVSNNGGQSFSANVPISDGASNATEPALDEFSQKVQYGDYSNLVFYDGLLIPVWTDNSQALGHYPDPPQFELAVGFSPTAHVADVPLVAQPLALAPNAILKGVDAPADLASFTDADPGAKLALYTATIDWGDQTDATNGDIRSSNGAFITPARKLHDSITGDISVT